MGGTLFALLLHSPHCDSLEDTRAVDIHCNNSIAWLERNVKLTWQVNNVYGPYIERHNHTNDTKMY